MPTIGRKIDLDDIRELENIVSVCIGTKFASRWGNLVPQLAIKSIKCVGV